jgi:iron(III) transport system ATP-binding protein
MVQVELGHPATRLVVRVRGDQVPHPGEEVGVAVPTPVQTFPHR